MHIYIIYSLRDYIVKLTGVHNAAMGTISKLITRNIVNVEKWGTTLLEEGAPKVSRGPSFLIVPQYLKKKKKKEEV